MDLQVLAQPQPRPPLLLRTKDLQFHQTC